ncbi:Hypothetical protein DPCES_3286 [Desulfitobacterium hafniense]|uniref:Uncharacterized protein n=1 Tax=Desulfitobacterium hafniense TaxID=49338 RepID=A0A098B2V1_DESHA|nr:Hypothetical protein DPCES_3286 [Desulfitobacterium hafniense]
MPFLNKAGLGQVLQFIRLLQQFHLSILVLEQVEFEVVLNIIIYINSIIILKSQAKKRPALQPICNLKS